MARGSVPASSAADRDCRFVHATRARFVQEFGGARRYPDSRRRCRRSVRGGGRRLDALRCQGVAQYLHGCANFCNIFVLELPGSTSGPQRHLYEEVPTCSRDEAACSSSCVIDAAAASSGTGTACRRFHRTPSTSGRTTRPQRKDMRAPRSRRRSATRASYAALNAALKNWPFALLGTKAYTRLRWCARQESRNASPDEAVVTAWENAYGDRLTSPLTRPLRAAGP